MNFPAGFRPPALLRTPLRRSLWFAGWLVVALPAGAQVGATFDTLTTAAQTYHAVKVLSASPATLTIKHAGGIAQVPLRELPAELQAKFGYDPARGAAHQREVSAAMEAQAAATRKRDADALKARTEQRSARAVPLFGQPAPVQPVDLRPEFRALDYGTKDQGSRPSCAIFAVVGALELENSRATGRLERLSEEYLIWATRRATGRAAIQGRTYEENALLQRYIDDIGFSLADVLGAAKTWGVALAAEVPAVTDARMSQIPNPGADVIQRAQHYRRLSVHPVPGGTNAVQLENIRHLLHAGVPVLIGVYWPSLPPNDCAAIAANAPSGGGGHAITLVGYSSATGRREDIRYIFRNSWSRAWGDEGYGTIEHGYLVRHLGEAAVIEVARGPAK